MKDFVNALLCFHADRNYFSVGGVYANYKTCVPQSKGTPVINAPLYIPLPNALSCCVSSVSPGTLIDIQSRNDLFATEQMRSLRVGLNFLETFVDMESISFVSNIQEIIPSVADRTCTNYSNSCNIYKGTVC